MKCRRIKKENQNNLLVWFGSYGKNQDGTAKFFNTKDKHDNFADEQEGLVDGLTQELSILQGELWYDINFGLPLLEKTKDKNEIDAIILELLLSHRDVEEILSFSSEITQEHHYSAMMSIKSTFGIININI